MITKRGSLLALLLALGGSQSSWAQQAWTPQPFVPVPQARPLSSSDQPAPANRLRGASNPVDDQPVVFRWHPERNTQQFSTSSHQSVFDEAPTPRANQISVTPAANWTDRTSNHSNRVVRSVVEPESLQDRWNDRKDSSTTVVPAQFDVPPNARPGSEATKDPFESNLLPPREKVPPSNGMRSLIEFETPDESTKKANPFPPKTSSDGLDVFPNDSRSAKDLDRSPSDQELQPPSLNRDRDGISDETPRTRSKPVKPTDIKCDDVRDRVLSANIGTIQLDVAPNFFVGPQDEQTPEEKREAFAKSAPARVWLDHAGSPIANGRLVDFSHDSVVIVGQSGNRELIPIRNLSEADAMYVFGAWGLPMTCSLGVDQIASRVYEPTTVAWKASGLCHKPLYFEEIQLERSGHEYGPIIQPAISSVHFFKNIALLPYKIGINPLTECQYALGHYRPGNCAPWSIEPVPLSLHGAAAQAKVITGAVLVFP